MTFNQAVTLIGTLLVSVFAATPALAGSNPPTVPEPATISLLAVGAAVGGTAVAYRFWRRK